MGVDLRFLRSEFLRTIGIYFHVPFAKRSRNHAWGATFSGTIIRRSNCPRKNRSHHPMPKVKYSTESPTKGLSKTCLTFGILPWDRIFLARLLKYVPLRGRPLSQYQTLCYPGFGVSRRENFVLRTAFSRGTGVLRGRLEESEGPRGT